MKLFKSTPLMLCIALSACSSVEKKPDTAEATLKPQAVQPQPLVVAPNTAFKADPAWVTHYEAQLREAVKGSVFEVRRYNDLLMVTAPADQSFNPDRPTMLMPSALGPITRIAKLVEEDRKTAVMVLGHADDEAARNLTQERAKSFAAIFRLSGLHPDRLQIKGMGSSMPRTSSNTKDGRAQNRRIEMVLTPKPNLNLLMAQYEASYPSLMAASASPAAPAPVVAPAAAKVAQSKAKASKAVAKAPTTAPKTAAKTSKPTQVAAADPKKKP